MKPLIGITASMSEDEKSHRVNATNVNTILRAGGVPILLPNVVAREDIEQLANQVDGLYATGGYDINPMLYGEEPHKELGTVTPARDHFELAITKRILEQNKPFLGVCRGAQILNVATDGDLYQDIYAQTEKELLQHTQKSLTKYGTHYVNVVKDSLLYRLTQLETLLVNSVHHQACRKITSPLHVSGIANDEIIEAIESKEHSFVLGVQWHPESMTEANDVPSLNIFKGFIKASKK